MLTTLLALCLFQPNEPAANAAARFAAAVETSYHERGHSRVRYDLARMRAPVQIRVHKDLGCLVTFDRPYDDSWASDATGSGAKGAYYSYQEWGVTPDGAEPSRRALIIRSVAPGPRPVNLFFLFGEDALEILVLGVEALEEADRVVRFAIEPKPAPPPEPRRAPKDLAKRTGDWARWLAMITRKDARTKATAHGEAIYSFAEPPFFVFFKPRRHSPPLTALEVTRGVRKANGAFRYEFPTPAERVDIDGQVLLILPNFAMSDRRERLYLRTQVAGERNASFVSLGRGPRPGGRR